MGSSGLPEKPVLSGPLQHRAMGTPNVGHILLPSLFLVQTGCSQLSSAQSNLIATVICSQLLPELFSRSSPSQA